MSSREEYSGVSYSEALGHPFNMLRRAQESHSFVC